MKTMINPGEHPEEALLSGLESCTPLLTLGFLRRSPNAVKVLDPQGRVLYLNDHALDFFSRLAEPDPIGRFWWDIRPDDMRHVLRNAVTRGGLGEVVRLTVKPFVAESSALTQSIVLTPMRDPTGRVVRLLVVSRDIEA